MQADTQADGSTRLRLVEIRQRGATLPIGGGPACVVTSPGACSSVAAFISAIVIGPRPPGTDATIEIAGRFVSARSLPSPLLAPSAPAVVDSALLRSAWRAASNRRRDELATAHATLRFARHRAEAALEHARARGAPPAPVRRVSGVDDIAAAEIEATERRVHAARAALATASGAGLTAAERAGLDARHREVGEAQSAIGAARRRDRAAAVARYEAAVRAEHDALAAAGIASYASMLVELARGAVTGADPSVREEAVRELADAEGALERLRRRAAGTEAVPEATPRQGRPEPLPAAIARLARECDEHSAALDATERELARLDQVRDADPGTLGAGDLVLVAGALFDSYRRAELLAGRLPVVFAGAFDGVRPEARGALVELLVRTPDVQAILVTADHALAGAVRGSGGVVRAWPDAAGSEPPRLLRRRGA